MTSEAAIEYQVDTVATEYEIDVHVHLPGYEGAVDYHWYVNKTAAQNQEPDNPVFDVEAAANFFGEQGLGLNRRTVDRIIRAIEFDIDAIPPAPDRQPDPDPDPDPAE